MYRNLSVVLCFILAVQAPLVSAKTVGYKEQMVSAKDLETFKERLQNSPLLKKAAIPFKDITIMCQYALAKMGRRSLDSQLKHDAHAAFKRTGKPLGIAAAAIAALVTATAITIWGYKQNRLNIAREQLDTAINLVKTKKVEELLSEYPALINKKNRFNQTPLTKAVFELASRGHQAKNYQTIDFLLKNDADVNIGTNRLNPLNLAVGYQRKDIIEKLLPKANKSTVENAIN